MGWSHPKTDSLAFILRFTPLSMAIIHSQKEARSLPTPGPRLSPSRVRTFKGASLPF